MNKYLSESDSLERKGDADLSFLDSVPVYKSLLNSIFKNKEHLMFFINWLSCVANTRNKTRMVPVFKNMDRDTKLFIKSFILAPLVGRTNILFDTGERFINQKEFKKNDLNKMILCLDDFNELEDNFPLLKKYAGVLDYSVHNLGKNYFNLIIFNEDDFCQIDNEAVCILDTDVCLVDFNIDDINAEVDEFLKGVMSFNWKRDISFF